MFYKCVGMKSLIKDSQVEYTYVKCTDPSDKTLEYRIALHISDKKEFYLEEKFNNRQKAEEKMIETFVEGKERETNKKENEEVFYLGKDEPSR